MGRKMQMLTCSAISGGLQYDIVPCEGWHIEEWDSEEFHDLKAAVDADPRHQLVPSSGFTWTLINPATEYPVIRDSWVIRYHPGDASYYFVVFQGESQLAAFEEWTEDHGWLPVRVPDRQAELHRRRGQIAMEGMPRG